jgi:hypothetical protein
MPAAFAVAILVTVICQTIVLQVVNRLEETR